MRVELSQHTKIEQLREVALEVELARVAGRS